MLLGTAFGLIGYRLFLTTLRQQNLDHFDVVSNAARLAVQMSASLCTMSGNRCTMRISKAAWAFGFARLERTLSPDAPPAAISSAVMDMLGEDALRAAELIERAVVAESLPHDGGMNTSAVIEPTRPDVNLQYRCFQSALQPENWTDRRVSIFANGTKALNGTTSKSNDAKVARRFLTMLA
jgi:hypothetical protein